MKEKLKGVKGVTLIALVITIIVLLILAGVSIATLTGDNGLLTKAEKAKEQTDEAGEKEAVSIAYTEALAETKEGTVTAEGLNKQFSKNGTKATATSSGDMIKVNFSESGRSYIVDAYGTVEKFDDIANHLKIGDYVNYPDKNGNNILCKVLYNDENYGVQLVSLNPVDTVTLGYGDPNLPEEMVSQSNYEKAKWSYNNAIKTLNDKAEEYRNPKYTSSGGARCIGSVPDNPYSEADDYFTSSYSYMQSYNGVLKNKDRNYKEDIKQLESAGALNLTDTTLSSEYWLSSREIYSYSNTRTEFNVNYLRGGSYVYAGKCISIVYPNGNLGTIESYTKGFRPVFSLNARVKIDDSEGKDGTIEAKAYDLQ